MHEYSVARALIAAVQHEACRRRAHAVRAVAVSVGRLSGVDPRLLATAYALCREGTLCDGVPLELHAVEPRWTCPSCHQPVSEGGVLRCAACGTPAALEQGAELTLDRIDVVLGQP